MQTEFRQACLNGSVDIVKNLLKSKEVDPNEYNGLCLVYAVRNNHLKIIRLLLSDGRCQPNTQRKGNIPIMRDFNLRELHDYVHFSNSQAFDLAIDEGNFIIALMILCDSRVKINDSWLTLIIIILFVLIIYFR